MTALPGPVQRLIAELKRLPGVGEKTATRYVLFWLQHAPEAMEDLARLLSEAARAVRACSVCGFVSEGEQCGFCQDLTRDRSVVCVVEGVADVLAIEKVGEYRGLYHVLGGVISALRGVSPEHLRVRGLLKRVEAGDIHEVILALGADAEGETTALYLHKVLRDYLSDLRCNPTEETGGVQGVRITRPATGIPMGSSIEFLDAVTLMRALRGRKEL